MQGVTIEVYPSHTELSDGFKTMLGRQAQARRGRFTYRDTEFRPVYDTERGGRLKDVKTVLSGLNTPLPAVYQDELTVATVTLTAEIPDPLTAHIGWYAGANFGLPGALCCVDPDGVIHEGKPQLYAGGENFTNVITLFRRVMAGEVTPGCRGNIWSSKVYRR
jgi:hypothetical protein